MHIPDGLLAERVYAPLIGVSGLGVALASWRAGRDLEERPGALPLTGVLAAFVFAAQMVNFPVLPGVSGHLLGGVLAGILLGPYCATIALTAVFVLQALWLSDGGVLALGANTFNMGIIGTFLGHGAYRALRGALGERPGAMGVAAFAASFLAVLAGALATYVEVAASQPRYHGPQFFWPMLGFHAVIGLFEGLITVGVLGYVARLRPDLVGAAPAGAAPASAPPPRTWPLALQMLAAAAVVGLVLARYSSELPDGFEAARGRADASAPPR